MDGMILGFLHTGNGRGAVKGSVGKTPVALSSLLELGDGYRVFFRLSCVIFVYVGEFP